MARIALAIAYDGARFDSYARQPDQRTVEGELIALLEAAGVFTDAGTAKFRSGSRTDKGVSAAWNVVAFDSSAAAGAVVAAGAGAPDGLLLLAATEAPPDFDPRRARRRTYRYLLDRPWDWTRVAPAARVFLGRHDFSNFRRADGDKPPTARVRSIRYRAREPGPWLEVEGDAFLWHQVRRMVAALERVETGEIEWQDVERALAEPGRRVDFGLAPGENLLLVRVDYDGVVFPPASGVARSRVSEELDGARRRANWATAVARGSDPRNRR